MVLFDIRIHPPNLLAYLQSSIELIIKVENDLKETKWLEAGIFVPQKISLAPQSELRRARIRLGILDENLKIIEKSVKIYANSLTNPQIYRIKAVLYVYDKNATVEKRIEKTTDIRCEIKKPEVI